MAFDQNLYQDILSIPFNSNKVYSLIKKLNEHKDNLNL